MRDRTNRIGDLQVDRELREKLSRPARSGVVGTEAPYQPISVSELWLASADATMAVTRAGLVMTPALAASLNDAEEAKRLG